MTKTPASRIVECERQFEKKGYVLLIRRKSEVFADGFSLWLYKSPTHRLMNEPCMWGGTSTSEGLAGMLEEFIYDNFSLMGRLRRWLKRYD